MSAERDGAGAAAIDPANMLGRVLGLPRQLRDARELALRGPRLIPGERPARLLVAGMGGSAIGGDFLAQVMRERSPVPVTVVRDDRPPRFEARTSAFLVVSYSGDTEETLATCDDVIRAGGRWAAVTSGGALAERARRHGAPLLEIPGGAPPRSAFGWTAVPLLIAAQSAGLLEIPPSEWEEAFQACEATCRDYGPGGAETGRLAEWAESCAGRLAIVYAPATPLAAVATRWCGQINENGKTLAHAALFPEQNHNEIVGWEGASSLRDRVCVTRLEDPEMSASVARRLELVAQDLGRRGVPVHRFASRPGPLLARLLSFALLGDFASLALAARTGADPTPVAPIDRLKAALASGKMVR